jgi:hypothetical protein
MDVGLILGRGYNKIAKWTKGTKAVAAHLTVETVVPLVNGTRMRRIWRIFTDLL